MPMSVNCSSPGALAIRSGRDHVTPPSVEREKRITLFTVPPL